MNPNFNRAYRRKIAAQTKTKMVRGIQDDPKKVVKITFMEKSKRKNYTK